MNSINLTSDKVKLDSLLQDGIGRLKYLKIEKISDWSAIRKVTDGLLWHEQNGNLNAASSAKDSQD